MTEPVWNGQGEDPWLPARLDARLEVDAVERDIRNAFWAALSKWLVEVGRRVLRGDTRPNPDAVWALVPMWREAVEQVIAGAILPAMQRGYEALLGTEFPWEQRVFVARHLAEVRNRMMRTPEHVFDVIAGEMSQGINLGEGIRALALRVEETLSATATPRWENRAVTVARTEAIGALNAGRSDAFEAFAEDVDGPLERVWVATEDSRTRPTHVLADGQRVPLGQPFIVGGAALMFPGDPSGPPEEVINCVIGSTEIRWPGQEVTGSMSRRHVGTFIQIITAEGHDLTITPNHPVLTPDGYVPAGLLRPKQCVMATSGTPSPDVDDVPSSAEEIHRALSEAGQPQRVIGRGMDFHGDGSDSEVEIVGANGDLLSDLDSEGLRQGQDSELIGLRGGEGFLSGPGTAEVLGLPIDDPIGGRLPASVVRGQGERPSLLGGHPSEAERIGFARTSDVQTHFRQPSNDGRTADSDFPAHLQYALAAGMAPTEIVEINRFTGRHQVYNLSTSGHWYTGNGITLHNCRCTLILVEPGESVDLSNRQMRR